MPVNTEVGTTHSLTVSTWENAIAVIIMSIPCWKLDKEMSERKVPGAEAGYVSLDSQVP